MTDLVAELRQLPASTLDHIAARALDRPGARVESFLATALGGGAGGGAVVRVNGTARLADEVGGAGGAGGAGGSVPWSAVVKRHHPPQGQAGGRDGSWCREVMAYRAGLVPDGSRGGLVAARCLEIEVRDDGAVWLWLEDLGVMPDQGRPLETHLLAAQHLGQYNGAWLSTRAGPAAEAQPWLSSQRLRHWVEQLMSGGIADAMTDQQWQHPLAFVTVLGDLTETALQQPEVWAHPLVRAAYPPDTGARLLRLWRARGPLLAAIDRFPLTLVHGDAHARNLFPRRGPDGRPQTVAIDWESVGLGPLGEDLGRYLGVSLLLTPQSVDQGRAMAGTLVERYLEGLRQRLRAAGARWPLTTRRQQMVRYTAYVNAAFLHGFWAAGLPPAALSAGAWAPRVRAGVERLTGVAIEDLVSGWAPAAQVMLDLADEALAWLV